MNYEKKRKVADKCEQKFARYQTLVNCAYIDSHNDSIVFHMHRIATLICTDAESAKDYDEIMESLSEEVVRTMRSYKKED